MPDFECPTCGGGFPSAAASGDCPWCGEAMAGREADAPTVPTNSTRPFADDLGARSSTRPLAEDIEVRPSDGFRFGGSE